MIFKEIIKQIKFVKFDNKTKKLFITDYNKKTIPYFRLSAIMTAIVSLPFAWLDLKLIPSNINFVWIIRFGIWLPMLGLAYFISYKSVYIKYFQIIVSFIILVLGFGITAMIFVSNKSDLAFTMYYSGIALIMIGVVIFRLRFIASSVILIILSFGYLLTAIFKQNLLFINEPINYSVVFINNAVFLLSFAIILTLASYILENYARNIFIQQQIIKEKNEELITSEEDLRQNNEELKTLNEHIVDQKHKIEKAHKHITGSIIYAKRIQEAMLPADEIFENNFTDYFIFFKPRDIVSGDFYWAEKFGDSIIYAVADCTGHGVPGAMVSMLGISLLNKITTQKKNLSASKILDQLRMELKKSLKQTGQNNKETNDGMDIALCIVDTKTNELQFSGAYNSLYIYRKNELIELKADKQPIGLYVQENNFTNHQFKLQKNDILYSFSDGFADQFNNNRQKFQLKHFRELIKRNASFELKAQKEIFEKEFLKWKSKNSQTDDVILTGIKI